MPFLQVSCDLDAVACQLAEDVLMEQGAMSVTLQDPGGDPILEPGPGEAPLWGRAIVLALFDEHARVDTVRRALERELGDTAVRGWRVEWLEDRAWERAWMDDFVPMRFGRRLWVCPSNARVDAIDAIVLKLDPGLAFGTGTHPSTALCLEWLDRQPLQGRFVIDMGCGSGILSIAALLLGAERVLGIDNDPQALIASRENARRNGVDGRLELASPDDMPADAIADVLVANILAGVLIRLAPELSRRVRSGGHMALSGILNEQAASVTDSYTSAFELRADDGRDGWALVTGLRRPSEV